MDYRPNEYNPYPENNYNYYENERGFESNNNVYEENGKRNKIIEESKSIEDKINEKIDYERIPLYIDYTEIIIDNENILTGSMVSWHDKPFYFEKDVKNDQIVNVQVSWLPLNKESNIRTSAYSDKFFNILSRSFRY